MKDKKELDVLKAELEALSEKLAELSKDELKQVVGGWNWGDNWGDEGYFNDLRKKKDES